MTESEKKEMFVGVMPLICKFYNEYAERFFLDKRCEDTLQEVMMRCWTWFSERYDPSISKPTTYAGNGVVLALRNIATERQCKKHNIYNNTIVETEMGWCYSIEESLKRENTDINNVNNRDEISSVFKHCNEDEKFILHQVLKGVDIDECKLPFSSFHSKSPKYLRFRVRQLLRRLSKKLSDLGVVHS